MNKATRKKFDGERITLLENELARALMAGDQAAAQKLLEALQAAMQPAAAFLA